MGGPNPIVGGNCGNGGHLDAIVGTKAPKIADAIAGRNIYISSSIYRRSNGKDNFGNLKLGRSNLMETDSQAPDLVIRSNNGMSFGT